MDFEFLASLGGRLNSILGLDECIGLPEIDVTSLIF